MNTDFSIPQPLLYPNLSIHQQPQQLNPLGGSVQPPPPPLIIQHQQPQQIQTAASSPPQSNPKFFVSILKDKKKLKTICLIAVFAAIVVGFFALMIWYKKNQQKKKALQSDPSQSNSGKSKWNIFKRFAQQQPQNHYSSQQSIRDYDETKPERMLRAQKEADRDAARVMRSEPVNDRLMPENQSAIPSLSEQFKDSRYRKQSMEIWKQQQQQMEQEQRPVAIPDRMLHPNNPQQPLGNPNDEQFINTTPPNITDDPNGAPLD